jgi:orotidine-5'-phosphate decarboxylase
MPPHVIKLADAKRGDVEHTARAYVRAFFDDLGFDACTVSPYLGRDSVEPWIERPEFGAFVLSRTSNPGAPDLQDVVAQTEGGGLPLYEIVASRAGSWDRHGNVGLVAGATYPAEMGRLREMCPEMPFLVPGIGAQAGSLQDAVGSGLDVHGTGLLVNASRGVMYASRGADFAQAARREALRLRDEINIIRAGQPAR